MKPEFEELRRQLQDLEHERAVLAARVLAAEQRAELAERSAREAWSFAKVMARTTGRQGAGPTSSG